MPKDGVAFFDSYTQQRLRVLNFQDDDKLVELAERCGALTNLEAKQALENAISNGKGGVFLKLTTEQYEKLTTEQYEKLTTVELANRLHYVCRTT